MKKSILYIATLTTVFCITLSNCSKKDDPAPSTTSGTTTSGTTTSGTTTSGTTTSGTTTSGTTTSGTTTSGTTTSGSTTSGLVIGGSGTFVINGISEIANTVWLKPSSSKLKMIIINAYNDKYSFQFSINTESLKDGTYAIGGILDVYGGVAGLAGVAVVPMGVTEIYYQSIAGGNVVVSGKNITINAVNLVQNTDETKKMTASCNITLQ